MAAAGTLAAQVGVVLALSATLTATRAVRIVPALAVRITALAALAIAVAITLATRTALAALSATTAPATLVSARASAAALAAPTLLAALAKLMALRIVVALVANILRRIHSNLLALVAPRIVLASAAPRILLRTPSTRALDASVGRRPRPSDQLLMWESRTRESARGRPSSRTQSRLSHDRASVWDEHQAGGQGKKESAGVRIGGPAGAALTGA